MATVDGQRKRQKRMTSPALASPGFVGPCAWVQKASIGGHSSACHSWQASSRSRVAETSEKSAPYACRVMYLQGGGQRAGRRGKA